MDISRRLKLGVISWIQSLAVRHRLARVTLGARVLRGIAVRGSRDEHGLNGAFYNIQLYIHNMCEPSSLNQHVHHCLAYHWRKPRPWS